MKKLFSAAILGASVTGIASAAQPALNPAGFYVAAQVGYGATHGKISNISTVANQYGRGFSADGGKGHGLVQVLAGYNWAWCATVAGLEAYAGYDNSKIRANRYDNAANGHHNIRAELKNNRGFYGIAARLGYFVSSSTMAFVRLAGEYRKYKLSVSEIGNAVANLPDIIDRKSKSRFSFAPGFGMETWLNKNVSIRADWKYLIGPKITLVHENKHGSANPGLYNLDSTVSKVRVRGQAFTVGVSYKF